MVDLHKLSLQILIILITTTDAAVLRVDQGQPEYIDNNPEQFYPLDSAEASSIDFFLDWQNFVREQISDDIQFKDYYSYSMDLYQQLIPKFPMKSVALDAYQIFQHALKVGSLPKNLKAQDQKTPNDVTRKQVAINTSAQTSNFVGIDFATDFKLAYQHLKALEQPKEFYYKTTSVRRSADNTMFYTWHKGTILDMIQLNLILEGNAEDYVLEVFSKATERWYIGERNMPQEQIKSSIVQFNADNTLLFAQWELLVFDYNYWIGLRYDRVEGEKWLEEVADTVLEDQARFNSY